MTTREIAALEGTEWEGTGEPWLNPLGDEAARYPCTLRVSADGARYTWERDEKTHEGTIELRGARATWSDTWHQPDGADGAVVKDSCGLLSLFSTYEAGGPSWGWRTTLSQRPTSELVLQMTNVAPWGEETRAVRMVFTRR